MILIFGGAYQGKLDFALEKFDLGEKDVYTCENEELDFSKRIIDKLEIFVRACEEKGIDPREYIDSHRDELSDKILISRDESCGLVPMDPLDRAYRETLGRTLAYIGKSADKIYRVFVGLGQELK